MSTYMLIILSSIVSTLIGCVLTWFLCKKKFNNKLEEALKEKEEAYTNRELELTNEHKTISDQFFKTNEVAIEQQVEKLNHAFLENGRTVEVISGELKRAQNLVSNAFSSLPNIHLCSQRSSDAAQNSKEKINALSQTVDSWQASMQSLQNIQVLIDAIHDKATQIRDISSEANLLALNASIEAARAGEHGRGFAVVATSMRELSNKSADATLDINTAVEKTRNEVGDIVSKISENVSLLTKVSSDVSESFVNIENEVSNITSIAKLSLSEAEESTEQFQIINGEVNTQLETIIGLLANTLGEITGINIKDLLVSADFSEMKIIDVRSRDEFTGDLGHIENAQLMCLQDNFDEQLQTLDVNALYLFVCRSGGRSARAARIALGHGFKHIFNRHLS